MKVFKSLLIMILTLALIVGIALAVNNHGGYRKITISDELPKETVTIARNDKQVDVLNLKLVKVGEKITINYEGTVTTEKDIADDFVGIQITGVEKLEDGTYIVIDNVSIVYRAVPETIKDN